MKLVDIKNMKEEQARDILEKEIIIKDSDLVRDICLVLENNYNTVMQLKVYSDQLKKKIEKGVFNYSLSLVGVKNIIDKSIKEFYIKPFYSKGSRIDNIISNDDRIHIYIYFLEDIMEELRAEIEI
ncbi:MAG: hypothetical protein IJ086_03655 [Clostridium sp.]|nr:hypothetical protein [Clostridium sp.]